MWKPRCRGFRPWVRPGLYPSTYTSCVTLAESLSLSEFQFPHLRNGHHEWIHLMGSRGLRGEGVWVPGGPSNCNLPKWLPPSPPLCLVPKHWPLGDGPLGPALLQSRQDTKGGEVPLRQCTCARELLRANTATDGRSIAEPEQADSYTPLSAQAGKPHVQKPSGLTLGAFNTGPRGCWDSSFLARSPSVFISVLSLCVFGAFTWGM